MSLSGLARMDYSSRTRQSRMLSRSLIERKLKIVSFTTRVADTAYTLFLLNKGSRERERICLTSSGSSASTGVECTLRSLTTASLPLSRSSAPTAPEGHGLYKKGDALSQHQLDHSNRLFSMRSALIILTVAVAANAFLFGGSGGGGGCGGGW